MIFVGTGAWFARFVLDDPNHDRMATWFDANNDPLLTTDYCVDETLIGRNPPIDNQDMLADRLENPKSIPAASTTER